MKYIAIDRLIVFHLKHKYGHTKDVKLSGSEVSIQVSHSSRI